MRLVPRFMACAQSVLGSRKPRRHEAYFELCDAPPAPGLGGQLQFRPPHRRECIGSCKQRMAIGKRTVMRRTHQQINAFGTQRKRFKDIALAIGNHRD
ncbi:hypothetical protein [Bradyrhizobium sp. AC87j1]|uniref:hypothetical protein n=1 Tax=Bradyrhizobium sp. AC87j1 TaxID=2055894 RepID=UPI0011B0D9EC|nr:hypothetical protein [Bradyrhizobium sp. AC87j1]